MEINARLTGGVELAIRAGVDFPTLLWRWAAKEPLTPVADYRSGVRMRFLSGDFEWLWENLKHRGRPDSVSPWRATAMFAREFLRPRPTTTWIAPIFAPPWWRWPETSATLVAGW